MSVFAKPAAKNRCPNCTSRACVECRTWRLECNCSGADFDGQSIRNGEEIWWTCRACSQTFKGLADMARGAQVRWDGNGRIA